MSVNNIYKKISELAESNEEFWIVTLTLSDGSIPGIVGMKMVVMKDGSFIGTIGGGGIERDVITSILKYKPKLAEKWTFNLGDTEQSGKKLGMLCGGTQEVLVEPMNCGGKLYIAGGGHCSISLAELAVKCGFSVSVLDNRKEWANEKKHQHADVIKCIDYNEIKKEIFEGDNTYIVIMTHGHIHDELVLRKIINLRYKYLGMIGSLKKVKTILDKLIAEGFSEDKVKSIFTPIGFNIKSHTPDEVAISIMAQLIAIKNDIKEIKISSNPLKN